MGNASEWIMLFRIGERLTLSVIIVIVSLVVMIGFWRSIQKIDFQMSREKIGAGGSIILGTPIFVLLALVGYAFVSLSNPISISAAPTSSEFDGKRPSQGAAVMPSPASGFTGISSNHDATTGAADNTEFERRRAVETVMSLNCLARDAGEASARVQDDLAAVKLRLLEPVWSEEWGNFEAFAASALGRSTEAPHPRALAVFQEIHRIC